MKTPTQLPVLVFLFSLTLVTATKAQESKDATILYNSQPVKVELSKLGGILTFYGFVPDYMAGYDLGTPKVANTEDAIDIITPITFDNNSKNAEYGVVSSERLSVKFQPGFATLSSESIATLNGVAQKFSQRQIAKVLITIYRGANDNEKLLQNRLASTVSYLNLKGVETEKIITEVMEGIELTNNISINFIE